jgi:hypothetical protein
MKLLLLEKEADVKSKNGIGQTCRKGRAQGGCKAVAFEKGAEKLLYWKG